MGTNISTRLNKETYAYTTTLANRYNLSRSTIINIAVAKMLKSKFKERYIKWGKQAVRLSKEEARTTWSTTENMLKLVDYNADNFDATRKEILVGSMEYIAARATQGKFLDLTYKNIKEKKHKYKRKRLL